MATLVPRQAIGPLPDTPVGLNIVARTQRIISVSVVVAADVADVLVCLASPVQGGSFLAGAFWRRVLWCARRGDLQ